MAITVPHPPELPAHIRAPYSASRRAWRASAEAVQAYSVRTLGYIDLRITRGDDPSVHTPELLALIAERAAAYEAFRRADADFTAAAAEYRSRFQFDFGVAA